MFVLIRLVAYFGFWAAAYVLYRRIAREERNLNLLAT